MPPPPLLVGRLVVLVPVLVPVLVLRALRAWVEEAARAARPRRRTEQGRPGQILMELHTQVGRGKVEEQSG